MDINMLRERAGIISETRRFFNTYGYLEVDVPLLSPDLIPESHLEVFRTEFISPYGENIELFLTPSPEIWMKRLIAEGSGSIFGITKSFRNYESVGRNHNPEFTMLEYYTVGADYLDSLKLTETYFSELTDRLKIPEGTARLLAPPFTRVTMAEAFDEYTGIDLEACGETEKLKDEAERLGHELSEEAGWEEIFNLLFVQHVEPELPPDRPIALLDYPVQIPALAKQVRGKPWYERWELYVKGIELANCYTEENDPHAVRHFFSSEAALKTGCMVPHPVNPLYPEIFSHFPPCSGVAMGLDRLVMLATGRSDIGGVIFFPFSDIIGRTE